MANLAITLTEIRNEVCFFLGYGRTYSAADTVQQSDIDAIIKTGTRWFYSTFGYEGNYVWSFLEKEVELDTVSGDRLVLLPDDFSTLQGDVTFDYESDTRTLGLVGDGAIRTLYAKAHKTGVPLYGAVRGQKPVPGDRTRYELLLYPVPSATHTLRVRYQLEPEELSTDSPTPLGGAIHSDTLLEACLAATEKRMNPEMGPGSHWTLYLQALKNSIAQDQEYGKTSNIDDLWKAETESELSSSLSIDREYIKARVGKLLGLGPNQSLWTYGQLKDVNEAIKDGFRKFYSPDPILDEKDVHVWSFLKPTQKLSVVSGVSTYDLPSDFSGLEGGFTYTGTTKDVTFPIITVLPEEELRYRLQRETLNHKTKYAAIRPKKGDEVVGTKWEVLFYPEPDANYVLEYKYRINPSSISIENGVPLGGQQHAQTVLAACLSAAEVLMGVEGSYYQEQYQKCLTKSVLADRDFTRPGVVEEDEDLWESTDASTTTLGVNHVYLKKRVAKYLGFSPNPGLWTHGQKVEIGEALREGLRRFYNPEILPNERSAHVWSFMMPVKTLSIEADVYAYQLPSDFSYLDGGFTYTDDNSTFFRTIRVIAEEDIRQLLQRNELSYRPRFAAIRTLPPDEVVGTRWEVLFYPKPSESYTLHYKYRINPLQMSEDEDLPLGGQPHARTLLEAVLAAAEKMKEGGGNEHEKKYLDYLASSVAFDRAQSCPDSLIVSSDYDPIGSFQTIYEDDLSVVTYGGVEY